MFNIGDRVRIRKEALCGGWSDPGQHLEVQKNGTVGVVEEASETIPKIHFPGIDFHYRYNSEHIELVKPKPIIVVRI